MAPETMSPSIRSVRPLRGTSSAAVLEITHGYHPMLPSERRHERACHASGPRGRGRRGRRPREPPRRRTSLPVQPSSEALLLQCCMEDPINRTPNILPFPGACTLVHLLCALAMTIGAKKPLHRARDGPRAEVGREEDPRDVGMPVGSVLKRCTNHGAASTQDQRNGAAGCLRWVLVG